MLHDFKIFNDSFSYGYSYYSFKKKKLIIKGVELQYPFCKIATKYDEDGKDDGLYLINLPTNEGNNCYYLRNPINFHRNIDASTFPDIVYEVTGNRFTKDFNVEFEYLESRENPTCNIYKIILLNGQE